jgi:GGDEF domain-containing protein
VLITFVDTLQATLEMIAPHAMLARTGGEEFMLILPERRMRRMPWPSLGLAKRGFEKC